MKKIDLFKVLETNDLIDSDKSYELIDSYKCLGIPPKTWRNLSYVNCLPNAKDKLTKDLL